MSVLVAYDSRPWPELSTPAAEKHNYFRVVVHKDADDARAFYLCHGAVGRDHQRPPSRVKYVSRVWSGWNGCDISLNFSKHLS